MKWVRENLKGLPATVCGPRDAPDLGAVRLIERLTLIHLQDALRRRLVDGKAEADFASILRQVVLLGDHHSSVAGVSGGEQQVVAVLVANGVVVLDKTGRLAGREDVPDLVGVVGQVEDGEGGAVGAGGEVGAPTGAQLVPRLVDHAQVADVAALYR